MHQLISLLLMALIMQTGGNYWIRFNVYTKVLLSIHY